MAKPDFTIKQNDTLPALNVTLSFQDGSTIPSIATATINFIYQIEDESTVAVVGTGATAVVDDTSTTSKIISYAWVAADTAIVGRFKAEVELIISGDRLTFPNGSYLIYDVVADLADG